MAYERLIIDGYSLIHRDPELKAMLRENLQRAREALIEKTARTATALAAHITIVFDGQGHGGSRERSLGAVEVIYSTPGLTADAVIERLVHTAVNPSSWLVVTNDRRERETVLAAGVQTMSCAVYMEECSRTQRHHVQTLQRRRQQQPGPKLGDFFPKEDGNP